MCLEFYFQMPKITEKVSQVVLLNPEFDWTAHL